MSLEFSDQGIEGLGVVLVDIKFNTGSIKGKDIGKRGINGLADRLGEIDHVVEHQLNVVKEVLFETGEKRGIGDFCEPAEIPQFLTEAKEEDEQGIGRNGKNLLKDKSRKEAGKRIGTFSSQRLVESIGKGGRDKQIQVDMFFEKLEKGRGIVKELILTV